MFSRSWQNFLTLWPRRGVHLLEDDGAIQRTDGVVGPSAVRDKVLRRDDARRRDGGCEDLGRGQCQDLPHAAR